MNKVKINREKLSSEYIESKQDFKMLSSQVHINTSYFNRTWFYGATGLAGVTLCVTFAFTNSKTSINDSKNTLEKTQTKSASLLPNLKKIKESSHLSYLKNQQGDLEKKNKVSVTENYKTNYNSSKVSNSKCFKEETSSRVKQTESFIFIKEEKNINPIVSQKVNAQNLERAKKINFLPSINGTFNGEIELSKIRNQPLIVSSSFDITSFEIFYSSNRGDKSQKVEGNTIPADILNEIEATGIDQMIFITGIQALDEHNEKATLTSMNLVVVLD